MESLDNIKIDKRKYTLFVKLCSEGKTEKVKNLLNSGEIDLNHDFLISHKVLFRAVRNENIEMIKILLEHGAQVDKGSPLHLACEKGNYVISELLINSGIDVNSRDKYSKSPIYYAVAGKYIRIVKLLLEKGANATDEYREFRSREALKYFKTKVFNTVEVLEIVDLLVDQKILSVEPLLCHAVAFADLALLRLLVNKEVDLELRIKADRPYIGLTPLSIACEKGNYEIVEFLINSGADVNGFDFYGKRPLYYAMDESHFGVIELLIKKGASLYEFENLTESDILKYLKIVIDREVYRSVLSFFHSKNYQPKLFKLSRAIINCEILTDLIDVNAQIESDSRYVCFTPLSQMLIFNKSNYLEILEILLKGGLDPNVLLETGSTALMLTYDVLKMKMLLKFGANINGQDAKGNTALHLSVYSRPKMEFLISQGIDVDVKNNENKTALDLLQEVRDLPEVVDDWFGIRRGMADNIGKMENISLNWYFPILHFVLLINRHDLSSYIYNVSVIAVNKEVLEDRFKKILRVLIERLKEDLNRLQKENSS